MALTEWETVYLRSVEKIARRNMGDAALGDVDRDMDWSEREFAKMTARLLRAGYIFITDDVVRLSPLGQKEITDGRAHPSAPPRTR